MLFGFGLSVLESSDGPIAELSATTALAGGVAGAYRGALFFRRFRRARCEFLEARIIPERIEHRIEPEQRGSEQDAESK
jgi:hypothetical protein